MATTFAQIQARVARLILEDGADVTAEIPQYIRDAQAEIEDDRTLKVLEDEWTETLASGANTLTKPDDFNSIRLEPYMREAALIEEVLTETDYTKLGMITEQFVIDRLSDDSTGAPKYWRETSTTEITIYPTVDDQGPWDDDYKITVPYWKRLDTLTLDADTNWFCDNAENYLIWFAGALGLELIDDNRFIQFFARATKEKRRLTAAESRGRLPGGWTLKPDTSSRIGSR